MITATPQLVRPRLTLAVSCVGMFLVLLDVTVVNVALPRIDVALGASAGQLQGVVTAYTVALTVLMLPGGRLTDRRRTAVVYATGLIVFGLASVLCAASGSAPVLVLARAVQGAGAALMLPSSMALLSSTHPEGPARARALGFWASVSACAVALGPVVGGGLVEVAGWRWVFLVNVPLVALALFGLLRSGSGLDRPEAGAGALFPSRRDRSPGFAVANLASFVMNSGGNAILFAFTLALQGVLGLDPLPAGLVTLTMAAPMAVLGVVGGRAVARYGGRPVVVAGFGCGALALALPFFRPEDGLPVLVLTGLGIGVGLGLLTPALVHAAVASVPGMPGTASAVNNVARQAGTSVGVALAGTVLGSVEYTARFVTGLHLLGVGVSVWWVLGLLLALRLGPGVSGPRSVGGRR